MQCLKRYDWIMFDADDTLFHFDAYRGLRQMFAGFGVGFAEPDYQAYGELNKPLWVDYQAGRINAQQLQEQRFSVWAERLQVPARQLNSAFLAAMADICQPLEGAVGLLVGKFAQGLLYLQHIRFGCQPQSDVVDPGVTAQTLKVGLVDGDGAKLAAIIAPHACYEKRSCLRTFYGRYRPK